MFSLGLCRLVFSLGLRKTFAPALTLSQFGLQCCVVCGCRVWCCVVCGLRLGQQFAVVSRLGFAGLRQKVLQFSAFVVLQFGVNAFPLRNAAK